MLDEKQKMEERLRHMEEEQRKQQEEKKSSVSICLYCGICWLNPSTTQAIVLHKLLLMLL